MQPKVLIIGAGMSGLCLAITLKQAGITDFTLVDNGSEIGGTWRDNQYPGLACDIPSSFYQFTFARNASWSRLFSPGAEIQQYLLDLVQRFGLRPHIRLDTTVVRAEHVDGKWLVHTADGECLEVDFLVGATGVMRVPVTPDIPGLADFTGPCFHSARWDQSVSLAGQRVTVIGTGSSGVQIVGALAGNVPKLTLFQRTPQWVAPAPNLSTSRFSRWVRSKLPAVTALEYRLVKLLFAVLTRGFIERSWQRRVISLLCWLNLHTVRDAKLRAKLTPDYQAGCKRLVLSGQYYRALRRPGVELITDSIARVEARGVVTADGTLHETDVIVLATGYDPHAYVRPMQLIGSGGQTLDELWTSDPFSYRSIALPGFPNFFLMLGPHSPFGNYSLMAVAETQSRYLLRLITAWQQGSFLTPTAAATERFTSALRAAQSRTVWTTGCTSWYLGKSGVPMMWPWPAKDYERMMAEDHSAEFAVEVRRQRARR